MENVKTATGKIIKKSHAHKINNEYYEKNVDVVLVNNRWNRVDNGIVAYDNQKGIWRKKSDMIFGYVLNGQGYFTPNLKNVTAITTKGMVTCLNEKAALNNGFVDEFCSDYYIPYYKGHDKIRINPKAKPKNYNIVINKQKYNLLKPMSPMRDLKLERFLKGIKFGFEFETSNGYIKSNKLIDYGVSGLLDGSLREDGVEPFEYTTIPHFGTRGLNYIKEFMGVLKTHCEHNEKCSTHINLSGTEVKKSNLIYLYNLLEKIQDDLFKMFPESRAFSEYCKKLKRFSKNYNFESTLQYKSYYHDIIKFLSCGYSLSEVNNIKNKTHPVQKQKWYISSRYYFVNLNDYYYNNNPRIEFRIHEGCFDFDKIFNWFLMCVKIIKFANQMDYQDLSRKITLDEVLFKGFYGKELKEYYMSRKKKQKPEIEYVQF